MSTFLRCWTARGISSAGVTINPRWRHNMRLNWETPFKAIFSVLLRDFEFEMAQPSESYRDDVSKMVIQLEQPCRVRYRRRKA